MTIRLEGVDAVGREKGTSDRALAQTMNAEIAGLRARYGGSGSGLGIVALWVRASTAAGSRARIFS